MSEKMRKSRAKRIVTLKFSDNAKTEFFRTCPEIYVKYGKEKIGISLNALWNVLAKNGFYKNKKCAISYQSIQVKLPVWE